MTATTTTTADTMLASPSLPRVRRPAVVADAVTIAWRNLLNIRRNPQLLIFATIQPVIFVLMFRYVFGGAIRVPGISYVNFLMPGIFVQTVVFGSLTTGVGLADDLHKGLIDRFRSLPMARSAVLLGRTLADLVRNLFVVALMCLVGVAVGWDPTGGPVAVLTGVALVLAFAYSLSWVFAIVGLSAPDSETAQAASFPISGAPRVRVLRVRPGVLDAVLAPGVREAPAGHRGRRRRPRPHDHGHRWHAPAQRGAVDRRDHRGLRAPRRPPLPARHLSELTPVLGTHHPPEDPCCNDSPTPVTATVGGSSCCGSQHSSRSTSSARRSGRTTRRASRCPAPSRSGRWTCSRRGSPRRPATPVRSSSLTPPASATRPSRLA